MLVYEETDTAKVPMLGVGRVLSANAKFDIMEIVQKDSRRAFVFIAENKRDYTMIQGIVEASVQKSDVKAFREQAEAALEALDHEMALMEPEQREKLGQLRRTFITRIEQLGGSVPAKPVKVEPVAEAQAEQPPPEKQ